MKYKDIVDFKNDLLKITSLDKSGTIDRIYQDFIKDEDNRAFFELTEEEAENLDPGKMSKGKDAVAKLMEEVSESIKGLDDPGLEEYKGVMEYHAGKAKDENVAEDDDFVIEGGDAYVVEQKAEEKEEIAIEKEEIKEEEKEEEKPEIEPMSEEEYRKRMGTLDDGIGSVDELAEMNEEMVNLGKAFRKQNPSRDNGAYNFFMALQACEKLGDDCTISEMKEAYGKLSVESKNLLADMDSGKYKNSKNLELRDMIEGIGEKAQDIFKDIDDKVYIENSEDPLDYAKPLSQLKQEMDEERTALIDDYAKYKGRRKKAEAEKKEAVTGVNEPEAAEEQKKEEPKKEEPKKDDPKKEEPEKKEAEKEEPYRMAVNVEGWGKEHFVYESKYSKKTNYETLKKEEKDQNKDRNKKPEKPDYGKLRMSKGASLEIKGEKNDVMENNKAIVPQKK